MSYDDRYDDRYDDGYDDRYDDDAGYADDYDDIDDSYGSPRPAAGGDVGDAEQLIRRVIDIIFNAPTVPLSTSKRVDGDELIELLDEAANRLPDELREARWMLKERKDFINKTRSEAKEMVDAARVQAERMVQRTEVVRSAEARARQVRATSEDDARRLKLETEDFLDQRLASFEILLDKLGKTVATGRHKLSIGDASAIVEPIDNSHDDAASAFFDQDR